VCVHVARVLLRIQRHACLHAPGIQIHAATIETMTHDGRLMQEDTKNERSWMTSLNVTQAGRPATESYSGTRGRLSPLMNQISPRDTVFGDEELIQRSSVANVGAANLYYAAPQYSSDVREGKSLDVLSPRATLEVRLPETYSSATICVVTLTVM
jgi:hypothetical protein